MSDDLKVVLTNDGESMEGLFAWEVAQAARLSDRSNRMAQLKAVEDEKVAYGTDEANIYRTQDAAWMMTDDWAYSFPAFKIFHVLDVVTAQTNWIVSFVDPEHVPTTGVEDEARLAEYIGDREPPVGAGDGE